MFMDIIYSIVKPATLHLFNWQDHITSNLEYFSRLNHHCVIHGQMAGTAHLSLFLVVMKYSDAIEK